MKQNHRRMHTAGGRLYRSQCCLGVKDNIAAFVPGERLPWEGSVERPPVLCVRLSVFPWTHDGKNGQKMCSQKSSFRCRQILKFVSFPGEQTNPVSAWTEAGGRVGNESEEGNLAEGQNQGTRRMRKERMTVLRKPEDYDQAQAYDGELERLPAGGYVCEIRKMEEKVTPRTGTIMVTVSFDIVEGKYKDFFAKQYQRMKARETEGGRPARWHGTYNVFPYTREGLTNPGFKGLLCCIERSNRGFRIKWPLNLDEFQGKKVGLLFREEEYEAEDRSVRTVVRAFQARTVDCILDQEYSVPARRTLHRDVPENVTNESQEFKPVQIDDEDLPF